MPAERSPNRLGSGVRDKDGDHKRRRRLQDPLPLETPLTSDAKADVNDSSYISDKKVNENGERIKNDVAAVPRSRSYFQHDDRGTAAQDGRRSGRRVTSERGWWKEYKDDEVRATRKQASFDAQDKEGKSVARESDHHVWRHDKFSEVGAYANPPAKKRRPFREEKLSVEPQPAGNSERKSSTSGSERREEKDRDRRPLERSEYERERERSFWNKGRVERSGFPSRERFNGGDRYRGRDQFAGRQGGYDRWSGGGGARVEKWKHDLFDDANKSPTLEKEEDPVAKVEALLAS